MILLIQQCLDSLALISIRLLLKILFRKDSGLSSKLPLEFLQWQPVPRSRVLGRSLWIPVDEGWISSSRKIRRIIIGFPDQKIVLQCETCEWSSRAWPCVLNSFSVIGNVALGLEDEGGVRETPSSCSGASAALCNLFAILSHCFESD